MSAPEITRLAPSPTGALHLGNARTFLVNWALARRQGWRIVLRIEDLDGPRIKPGAAASIVETLRWLGMDWDVGPIVQSDEPGPHHEAMRALARAGRVYPCELTRGQIEAAASAPHDPPQDARSASAASAAVSGRTGDVPGMESRFPPELRPPDFDRPREFDPGLSWRFVTPEESVRFTDDLAGEQTHTPARTIGDFVVWTKRRQPSYQLAVVVDDHRQGVTRIVRGDDLLDSASRQALLRRALGFAPEPRYCHLPLVVGTDGKRLAKRHGDTRVGEYRARGTAAERIIGLVGWWCGVSAERRPMRADEFRDALTLSRIPRRAVVFTKEDDAWLGEGR